MKKKSKLDNNPARPTQALWLISYADMMTLIACFFILMMAFAHFDPIGFTKKTIEISKHFNKDKYKSSETKLTLLHEEISRHPELKKLLKISVKDEALIVTFSGSTIFERDSYELSDKSRINLDILIDLIKVKDPTYKVIVEGHTDNQPISKIGPFSSNWALSGARAASIISRFEYFGFPPKNLVAIGLGDSEPLAPNEDDNGDVIAANLKINNRTVIKVIEQLKPGRKIKMGLGVYFDEQEKE